MVIGISKSLWISGDLFGFTEIASLVNLALCANRLNFPQFEILHPCFFALISFIGKTVFFLQ